LKFLVDNGQSSGNVPPAGITHGNAMGHTATDFLTASSSFLIGAGSAFALAGNYPEFNRSRTEDEADHRAIRSDWEMVGRDIWQAAIREKVREIVGGEAK
jgi:hypothetical protein